MAFPTSPSNNQVHKEDNRTFVYDSALGVWDQVKESVADRLGRISSQITFPAGHVIQTVENLYYSAQSQNISSTSAREKFTTSGGNYSFKGQIDNVLADSKVLVHMLAAVYVTRTSSNQAYFGLNIFRDTASPASLTSGTNRFSSGTWSWGIETSGAGSGTCNFGTVANVWYLDDTPDTGTNHYYLAGVTGGSNTIVRIYTTIGPAFSCTLQEIKQ